MEKIIIAISHKMNGDLDDDYTLYNDGSVLHEYDRHRHRGGTNLKETILATEIKDTVKERLLNAAENKELAKRLLEM